MSHTFRKYPAKYKSWRVADVVKNGVTQGRDGALKLEKHLKREARHTGWTDDGIWTPEAKRRNKRLVNRENRHYLNAQVRKEDDE